MYKKLLSGAAFGFLATIGYRRTKQKVYAANDSEEVRDASIFRRKNGRFCKNTDEKKEKKSEEKLKLARTAPRSEFESRTNSYCTRGQEVNHQLVIVTRNKNKESKITDKISCFFN